MSNIFLIFRRQSGNNVPLKHVSHLALSRASIIVLDFDLRALAVSSGFLFRFINETLGVSAHH